MKKLFLSLAMMMAVVFSANAQQYSKGDMTVGGYAYLNSSFDKDYQYIEMTVGPTFNWFFADNWSLGATIEGVSGIDFYKDANGDKVSDAYNSLYFSPGISYVFGIGQRWGMINTVYADLGSNEGDFGWALMYAPSFYFFINDNWAVNVKIGSVGYNSTYENFGFNVGSLGAGISWRF